MKQRSLSVTLFWYMFFSCLSYSYNLKVRFTSDSVKKPSFGFRSLTPQNTFWNKIPPEEAPNLFEFVLEVSPHEKSNGTSISTSDNEDQQTWLELKLRSNSLSSDSQKINEVTHEQNINSIRKWEANHVFAKVKPTQKIVLNHSLNNSEQETLNANAAVAVKRLLKIFYLLKRLKNDRLNLPSSSHIKLQNVNQLSRFIPEDLINIVQTLFEDVGNALIEFVTAILNLAETSPIISILLFIAFIALVWKIIPAHVGAKKHHKHYRSFNFTWDQVVQLIDIISKIENAKLLYKR